MTIPALEAIVNEMGSCARSSECFMRDPDEQQANNLRYVLSYPESEQNDNDPSIPRK